jgi:mono/diheme cytochrome c family protein
VREQQPMRPAPPLEVPGLPRRRAWRVGFPKPLLLVLLALPLAVVALLPVGALARFSTSDSQYCLSCHGAGDTPDRAVRSLVHPDHTQVACVDCHAKHGSVVYEGYVKGFAAEPERVSPACERCHVDMRVRNDQDGFKYNFADIRIPHQQHLESGATCVTCHTNVAHDLRTPQTNRPRMEYCYTCHTRTESCAKCHRGTVPQGLAPFSATALGDLLPDGKMLYTRECSGCHGAKGDGIATANLNSGTTLADEASGRWRAAVVAGVGSMPPMARARGGPLTDDQVTAVLAYLKLQAVEATAKAPDPQDLYNRYCVSCHGAEGGKIAAVPLNKAGFWQGRSDDEVRRAIRLGMGGSPAFGAETGGPLHPAEVAALASFVRKLAAEESTPTVVGTAESKSSSATDDKGDKGKPAEVDGRALYERSCAMCHGADGAALPSANLGSKDYLQKRGAEELAKATRDGRGAMPGFGAQLSDAEIAGIVGYLLSR